MALQHCKTIVLFTGNPASLMNIQTKEAITEQLALFVSLNEIAGRHGIGRIDIVENRFLGLKVNNILCAHTAMRI